MTRPGDEVLPQAPRGMIDRGLTGFRHRRVLMLQGPIGPFFNRLASDLREAGAVVFRVCFNGGDRLFTRRRHFDGIFDYRGTMDDWPARFQALVTEHRIDTILLFGDCRPIHLPAITVAQRLALEIGVFEEGYLRPDFITIERDGVNNHSTLPKNPAFYRAVEAPPAAPTAPLGSTFGSATLWGMLYYCAASGLHWRYPHHQYHRPLGWRECRFWARSAWRKLRYRLSERQVEQRFLGDTPVRFFLVALQTSGDAQVRVHSPFQTVERFIEHVIRDFAAHAPADIELAIKHHPLDRGFSDHRELINRLAADLGVADRCHYLHDQHLPTLLRRTLGVVTINSTVGLSAVGEGVPVMVCGEAIYDIAGLVFEGPLSRFWTDAADHRPDFRLWQAFRNVLVATTQFNGSFYKRHPASTFASGVFWDKRLPTTADDARIPFGPSLQPRAIRPVLTAGSLGSRFLPARRLATPEEDLPAGPGAILARSKVDAGTGPDPDDAEWTLSDAEWTLSQGQEQAFDEGDDANGDDANGDESADHPGAVDLQPLPARRAEAKKVPILDAVHRQDPGFLKMCPSPSSRQTSTRPDAPVA